MSEFIAWLDSPENVDTGQIGGKGASLARLGAAGFPVPPGFAVTVAAYRAFHAGHGLDESVARLVALDGRPTQAQVREACEPIVAKLEHSRLPDPVSKAIAEAYGQLDARTPTASTYAVRSSGVSEDSAGASFAGLYESYLNLSSADQVLHGVLDCYRCLWQPRAVHYRAIKGIDHRKEAMGVVVMQTVQSHVSGVAFSLNPVTGARDEVVINASWGLGEAIVSGLVTPDNYVALKDGTVARKDVFEKHVRIVSAAGGTEQQDVPANLANAPALTDEQIGQVGKTVADVERHYGCPVDVEFAYSPEGHFYLLQARPITTV